MCDGNMPIYFSDGGAYCDRRGHLVEESWIEHEHATLAQAARRKFKMAERDRARKVGVKRILGLGGR